MAEPEEQNQAPVTPEKTENATQPAPAAAEQTTPESQPEPETQTATETPAPAEPAQQPLPDFNAAPASAAVGNIKLLRDVELDVKIELGRAVMTVDDILRLSNGSVVELDKLAGDPVDILVNEQLVARGEVLVVNDNFSVRINEIMPGISEEFAAEPA